MQFVQDQFPPSKKRGSRRRERSRSGGTAILSALVAGISGHPHAPLSPDPTLTQRRSFRKARTVFAARTMRVCQPRAPTSPQCQAACQFLSRAAPGSNSVVRAPALAGDLAWAVVSDPYVTLSVFPSFAAMNVLQRPYRQCFHPQYYAKKMR